MVTYANGLIPTDAMTRLSVGGHLLAPAARNFELLRAAASQAGHSVAITSAADAFRTYEIQKRIFLERFTTKRLAGRPMKVWNGVTYWLREGQAMAATPGTSNHGKGLAVDIKDVGGFNSKFYRWLALNAPRFGWSNAEGRSINEAWHWVNDNVPRGAVGIIPGVLLDEDELMTAEILKTLDEIKGIAMATEAKVTYSYGVSWFQAADTKVNSVIDRLVTILETTKLVDASVSSVNRNLISYLQHPTEPFGFPAASHNALGAVLEELAALRAALSAVAESEPGETPDIEKVFEAARAGAAEGMKSVTWHAETATKA